VTGAATSTPTNSNILQITGHYRQRRGNGHERVVSHLRECQLLSQPELHHGRLDDQQRSVPAGAAHVERRLHHGGRHQCPRGDCHRQLVNHHWGGTAIFKALDSTTQGNWPKVYGSEGYSLVNDQAVLPAYHKCRSRARQHLPWAASTSDVRAVGARWRRSTRGLLVSAWELHV